MPKKFNVPIFYRSPIISQLKRYRREIDPLRRDLSPLILDFGSVKFKIARHFGFCFGVENAIEIAYRAIEENPKKEIFLLSEIIHNSHVNSDLQNRGVKFICDTSGKQLIPFDRLKPDDIVIVPAFGTTLEIEKELQKQGVDPLRYNTTCPFVEKVWKKSNELGKLGYTVVIHGKWNHEETRATFSHSKINAPVLVIRDISEAKKLEKLIRGEIAKDQFFQFFKDRCSVNFEPEEELKRIGVVNQTTMLASETEAIAELLRQAMIARYGVEKIDHHFADTRDTLCYATKENQEAVLALIDSGIHLALVVGGYNSSNTSHLVELLDREIDTYFICSEEEIYSSNLISSLDLKTYKLRKTENWLPIDSTKTTIEIGLTAGASCPDALLDGVLLKVLSLFPDRLPIEEVMRKTMVTIDL